MADSWTTLQRWLADVTTIRLIEVAIGLVLISLSSRALARLLSSQLEDSDLRYRLRKTIGLASYAVMLLLVLIVFSDSLGRLTVVFGVVGAGVAFALQEVIASVAGWAAISLGQFYTTGDRVQLGGIMGDVIDVSPLRTTLMECGDWVKSDLYNGRIVRIANSFVFKEPVFNYSGDFPYVWDEVVIPIRHGSDHHLARALLLRVLEEASAGTVVPAREAWSRMTRKYRIDAARIESTVTLVVTDNWLEFTLRYVVDFQQRRFTKDRLFSRILDEIEASTRSVELASSTVELVAAPALRVRLDADGPGRGPAAL